jgi:hypothetical protein
VSLGPEVAPLSAPAERLQRNYRPAFLRYLSRRDEQARHAGYELGRAAVGQGQEMLDLVAAHHVTLLEVLPDARDPDEGASMCTAAAEFLTEVLASFAMASSAFAGVREQLREAQDEVATLRARLDALGEREA